MVTFRDLTRALRQLELDSAGAVIAHASLSAFGGIRGGSETLLGALLGRFPTLVMPAFTYKTMVTPEVGPPDNGIVYGSGGETNRMAEFFDPHMPVDRLMGVAAETLRRLPSARRSAHPVLSFVGVHADALLEAQHLQDPLAPLGALRQMGGWILLLGVDHTVNTSIHYAEHLAGRKQFIRWALTPKGVVECPAFPGCSDGFQAVVPRVEGIIRSAPAGATTIQAAPLDGLVATVCDMIAADPSALLCARKDCARCNAVRAAVSA